MQRTSRDAPVQKSDLIHVEKKEVEINQKLHEVIKKNLKYLHFKKNMTQNRAE